MGKEKKNNKNKNKREKRQITTKKSNVKFRITPTSTILLNNRAFNKITLHNDISTIGIITNCSQGRC